MNRRLAFLLAIVAQFAFLGWMIAGEERLRSSGRAITLAVEPFDPIDPLSGRYLAIRVKASRVDLRTRFPDVRHEVIEEVAETMIGREVVVTLAEEGGRCVALDVSDAIEHEPGRGPLVLRGTARRLEGTRLVIDYGLDRFFIPSDAADPSPLLWKQDHELAIVARVDPYGHASIEDLLIDGQPFSQWNAAQKAK